MAAPTSASAAPVEHAASPASLDEAARAERAQRIAAMLDRWATEDCADEPDWDVSEVAPLRLGVPDAGHEP